LNEVLDMEDPYKILGVSKDATLADIKKAYRGFAKKHHPDLNPGNKEAEAKFKAASHAFDQIGTAEARAKYDRGETDEQQRHAYEEAMKGGGRRQQSYYNTQQDSGRYAEQFGEGFDTEGLFEQLFGGKAGGRQRKSADRPGEDQLYNLEVELKDAALGGTRVITLPSGKRLEVKIPAGIEEGKKLKFKGHGGASPGNGPAGDAYVQISIRPSDKFKREGHDIHTEVPVSFYEALLGAEIPVPTLDGQVLLKIPSGATTGSKLRIKNKGVGASEHRGNLIVTLKVVMPKTIDPALKEEIQSLSQKYSYDPRILS
jgi:DnaJ-class molecular chaperone